MPKRNPTTEVLAVKDEENQRPIPTAWRPVFREVVKAFVKRDYRLKAGVPGVAPVDRDVAEQIENYIEEYGETLVELPDETWDTSVCIWMGKHWDAIVDLWTAGEGRSDMVLSARVSDSAGGFLFKIELVYVP